MVFCINSRSAGQCPFHARMGLIVRPVGIVSAAAMRVRSKERRLTPASRARRYARVSAAVGGEGAEGEAREAESRMEEEAEVVAAGKVNAAEGQKLIADADEAKAEKTQEDAVAKAEEVEEAEEELLWASPPVASPPVALPLPLPLGLPFTW
jgi:hypothetical protein